MNDEKRHKGWGAEIILYWALIIAVGIMAMINYLAISAIDDGTYGIYFFGPPALLALAFILLILLFFLFVPSWSLRRHLLIWYGCLTTAILLLLAPIPVELVKPIFVSGAAVLLVLPVIWIWKASRS